MLEKLGGTARWVELREHVSQRAIEKAVHGRAIVRIARGVYRLPNLPDPDEPPPGVYSHVTAAELWELGVLWTPKVKHVTLPRNASRVALPNDVHQHYADLPAEAVSSNVTTPLQTVLDCARWCRFAEALAIADTAVRLRMVSRRELAAGAAKLHGSGSRQARRVAAEVDPRAHSPLESALRALLLDAGVSGFVPQYVVRADGSRLAQVDLGHPVTGVLLEADSFYWHGNRGQLERDAFRYNTLVSRGYLVLRFAYEHVLGHPDWVVETIRRTMAMRDRSAEREELQEDHP